MLSHISALTDGLMWTRTGTVWAVWRVSPVPYAFQPDDKKHAARRHHTALYRALRGESLHLGLTAATDPASVVLSMIEGVDLTEREAWAAECEATLDFLEQIPIGRRVHWIAAPLANPGAKAFLEPLHASWTTLQDTLMMPRSVPGRHAIGERAAQAEGLRKEMPSAFDPRPATVAEMAWMFGHAMQRGLGLDTAVPVDGSLDAEMHLSGPSVLPSSLVDPAGQTDSEKKLGPLQILKRPYIKVLDPTNPDLASYQTTLVVSDTPSGGIVYPGCEWIGRVDESGVPCDWAIRMTVRSRDEVTNRNRRAVRTLNDQFDQRSEEERAGSSLDTTARALGEYQAVMDADELEVEVDATTMFTVSGHTPEQALDDARDLTKYFAAMQFSLRTDPTIQPTLFEATLPGMPTPRAVREYSQITTARAFSAAVPFATTELGDTSGALFALEISNGAARPNPVFVNLAGATDKLDVALAMGFVGELGAGKALALDTPIPTPSGWTTMGELAPGDRVIDENGVPTEVVGVSAVMRNHQCYEVVFSDGSTIVADAEHLWTTVSLKTRTGHDGPVTGPGWYHQGETATTDQLRTTLFDGDVPNHAIPVADSSGRAAGNAYRYITEVRPVESVPVRCIRVAAESSLFLAGEAMIPTHNSVSMKTVAMDNVDMGATLMAVDHTEMGEWGVAVSEIPGSQVVEISEDAKVSMDPLRILPPAQAPRVARSFITVLLSVQTKSEQNVLLSKVLQTEYMWRHKITSLGSLARHLEEDCEYAGARMLADEMRIFSELDFGRALFDDSLPPLDLSSPAIVLHTHKMQLPSKADMEHGHLFAELKAEKVFGRATFALIAALARYRCFADRSRLDIFAADEASKTMSSPEAAEEIGMFIRDGRKHKAALLLGSHDAEEDFGNEVVRGLIPFRVLLRHRDANLARRGLRWLHGLSHDAPVDEGLVKLVTEGTAPVIDVSGVPEERRGECLIRDFQARYGRAKVMAPLVEKRAETVKTTPTSSTGAVIGS